MFESTVVNFFLKLFASLPKYLCPRLLFFFSEPVKEIEVIEGKMVKLSLNIKNTGFFTIKEVKIVSTPPLQFGYTTSVHFDHTISVLKPGLCCRLNVFDPIGDINKTTYTVIAQFKWLFRERVITQDVYYL